MKLSDFAIGIVSTCGERSDGAPSGPDWELAVIDALIVHCLWDALANDLDANRRVAAMLQMANERAAEWLPTIVFEHEKK